MHHQHPDASGPVGSNKAWDETKYAVQEANSSRQPWDGTKYAVSRGANQSDTGDFYGFQPSRRPSYDLLTPVDTAANPSKPSNDDTLSSYAKLIATARHYDELEPAVPVVSPEYAYVLPLPSEQQQKHSPRPASAHDTTTKDLSLVSVIFHSSGGYSRRCRTWRWRCIFVRILELGSLQPRKHDMFDFYKI